MLLGLDVLPQYRRQGLASEIMRRYVETEKSKRKEKLILTCLDAKVAMYQKMGYEDLGLAQSSWGRRRVARDVHTTLNFIYKKEL